MIRAPSLRGNAGRLWLMVHERPRRHPTRLLKLGDRKLREVLDLAPRAGFEPATNRLTVASGAIGRNGSQFHAQGNALKIRNKLCNFLDRVMLRAVASKRAQAYPRGTETTKHRAGCFHAESRADGPVLLRRRSRSGYGRTYFDETVPGLALRVTEQGHRSWSYLSRRRATASGRGRRSAPIRLRASPRPAARRWKRKGTSRRGATPAWCWPARRPPA